jgi:hypothetical protein
MAPLCGWAPSAPARTVSPRPLWVTEPSAPVEGIAARKGQRRAMGKSYDSHLSKCEAPTGQLGGYITQEFLSRAALTFEDVMRGAIR